MRVNNVSFGSVISVWGKDRKTTDLKNRVLNGVPYGTIMVKDVTEKYKYAPSWGLMAQASQRGETVQIYITGEDVQKIKDKKSGWDTLDGILSNMSVFYDLKENKVKDVANKIIDTK